MRQSKKDEKLTLRFFIYPEKDHYVGVCLDLNIVEEGDDLDELKASINEAAEGYVQLMREGKLNKEQLMKMSAPKRYWDKYKNFQTVLKELENQKNIFSSVKKKISAVDGYPFMKQVNFKPSYA